MREQVYAMFNPFCLEKPMSVDDADDDYDGEPREDCWRCGGDGVIDYMDAGPDVWGEDCPSEVNHLVTCPDCGGTGLYTI